MTKKISSHPRPGSSRTYGSPAFFSRPPTPWDLRADHLLEGLVQLLLLFRLEAAEDERVFEERLVGKDQLVLGERGVTLGEDLPDAFDRADVVDVFRDVGLHLGPVYEVDHLLRGERGGRADRDLHVVRPQVAARLRHDELDVRVVGLEL